MRKTFIEYIQQEMKYLQEEDGRIVDTTNDETFISVDHWMQTYFRITQTDFEKALKGLN